MRRQALFKLPQEALFTALCLLQNLLFTLLELFASAQCRDILLERDEDNHLTVRALLDGRKRNFMVDTGWAMTTVSKATVRRLKTLGELGVKLEDSFLGTLSDSSMVLMEKLTLGPADFLNQPAEAMKLNMEGRSFGHDGVLDIGQRDHQGVVRIPADTLQLHR